MIPSFDQSNSFHSLCNTQENRKLPKPLIEKKRRARINQSLSELRILIQDFLRKQLQQSTQFRKGGKIEKADILDYTVDYIQNMHKEVQVVKSESFDMGFQICAQETCKYLQTLLSDRKINLSRKELIHHMEQLIKFLQSASIVQTSITSSTINFSSSSCCSSSTSIEHKEQMSGKNVLNHTITEPASQSNMSKMANHCESTKNLWRPWLKYPA